MEHRIEVIKTEKYCYFNAYLGSNQDRVGKLAIEYMGDKKGKIIYVITTPSHIGQGIATALLNRAIGEFKDYELYLNVIPMPRKGESINHRSVKGLSKFYEKFGFEKTSDPCVPTMIRKPSLPTLGE